MAGQDATLSLKQAKAQQERTCANNQQGPSTGSGAGHTETMSQEKKREKY